VVIGTPGRINSLVDSAVLCLDHIQIFVLDEADKLFESCFSKDVSFLCCIFILLIKHIDFRY